MRNLTIQKLLLGAAIPILLTVMTSCSPPPADEKTLTAQAKQAEHDGKWQEAIDRAHQLLKINERNIDAHWVLAQSYLETKEPKQAIDECKWLIKSNLLKDVQQEQNVHFLIGVAYMDLNDLTNAETYLEDAYQFETDSFNPMLLGAYGQCLVREKKYGPAIEKLDQAIALNQKSAQMFWLRGQAKRFRGNTQDAMEDYDEANALEPGNAEIAADYASFLEDQKLYRQALYVLALMRENNPRANVADAHDRIWQKALVQAKEDQQKRPAAPVPQAYLAYLYMDKNDVPNTKQALQKAFELHGDDVPLAWRIKGDLAALDGNYKEAVADYDKAFEVFRAITPGRDLGSEVTKLHKQRAKEKLGSA